MTTLRYPKGRGRGRPRGNMLIPEHAEKVRAAVRLGLRRFGIRMEDLDPEGSWVIGAMRTGTKLSAEQAERLFRLVQQPDAGLVKGKNPQGMSFEEAQAAIERFKDDPEKNPLPSDITIEWIGAMQEAAQIVHSYLNPLPGSTFFVTPGTAKSNATAIVESFLEEPGAGGMSASAARALLQHLEYYFSVAERPLRHPDQKALLKQLTTLGLVNRFELADVIDKAFPEEQLFDPMPTINALDAAEKRRSETTPTRRTKKSVSVAPWRNNKQTS